MNDVKIKEKNSPKSQGKSELVIEITQFCPQECIFCSSDAGPHQTTQLSLDEIRKIVLDAKKLQINSIHLSGGEPLSHPDMELILDFLAELDLPIVIYTCGIYQIDGKRTTLPENLIKKISTIKNCIIRFNFQAASRDIFEEITQTPGSFKLAKQSLKLCKKYKIPREAHIVPTLLNLPVLKKTIRFLLKSGISKVKILRFVAQGRGEVKRSKVDPLVNPELYWSTLNSLKNIYNPQQVEIGSAFSCRSNAHEACSAGIKKMAITPKYFVYPCVAFKSTKGRSLEGKSLIEITHDTDFSPDFQRIKHSKCNDCYLEKECDEICPKQIDLCNKFKSNSKIEEKNRVLLTQNS